MGGFHSLIPIHGRIVDDSLSSAKREGFSDSPVANVFDASIFFMLRFAVTVRDQPSIRDPVGRVLFDREVVLHFDCAGL